MCLVPVHFCVTSHRGLFQNERPQFAAVKSGIGAKGHSVGQIKHSTQVSLSVPISRSG